MKTLLLVPDSVGIRNFLCSRFPHYLIEEGEVHVWHALPPASVAFFQQRFGDKLQWQALPDYPETLIERIFRQAKVYAQLHGQNDFTLQLALRNLQMLRSIKARWIGQVAQRLGSFVPGTAGALKLDRLHKRAALWNRGARAFENYLRELRPDIVFCTQQRAHKAVPAFLSAQKLGIPTATFIYSWDNLPKGRMAVHSDYFLVWSDYMKNEMQEYYPDITPERVIVTGTPQFEGYFNQDWIKPREVFLRALGVDPARPAICFSGDDVLTSPHDPVFLADLAQALRTLPEAGRPQIVFRRSPVDWTPRYDDTFKRFPEIIVSDPVWSTSDSGGDWTQFTPTEDDMILLSNLAHHMDLVINLGSTMAMDFAITGKPAIFIAYNPPNKNPYWNVEDIYRMPHFKPVHALQPVYWAKSPYELAGLVQRALAFPQEKEAERQAWLKSHAAQPFSEASWRCSTALKQIAQRSSAVRFEPKGYHVETSAIV
ncbi:MAG: hypothetical protein HYR56_02670 [Acidobacteria bacterium]|nr:hypothetical protein [Acidobacteriota bacterium]MBI3425542.1 hypothetical protein [Acidobacteriota bacterium]